MAKETRETAIADTGFLYALINKKDGNHEVAKRLASAHNCRQWITTCFVFHEVFYLTNERCPHLISNIFRMHETELLKVVNFEPAQFIKMANFVEKYADQKPDLADVSLILLAETLGHGDIFTLDRKDFTVYKWGNNRSFNILD